MMTKVSLNDAIYQELRNHRLDFNTPWWDEEGNANPEFYGKSLCICKEILNNDRDRDYWPSMEKHLATSIEKVILEHIGENK